MKIRYAFLVPWLFVLSIAPLFAKDWSKSPWEGFWVAYSPALPTVVPTKETTYMAIAKLSNEFLVVATSTKSAFLSFFAKGRIDKNGALLITTNSGQVWLLSKPTTEIETIAITDRTGEYDVEYLRRVESSAKIPIP